MRCGESYDGLRWKRCYEYPSNPMVVLLINVVYQYISIKNISGY